MEFDSKFLSDSSQKSCTTFPSILFVGLYQNPAPPPFRATDSIEFGTVNCNVIWGWQIPILVDTINYWQDISVFEAETMILLRDVVQNWLFFKGFSSENFVKITSFCWRVDCYVKYRLIPEKKGFLTQNSFLSAKPVNLRG